VVPVGWRATSLQEVASSFVPQCEGRWEGWLITPGSPRHPGSDSAEGFTPTPSSPLSSFALFAIYPIIHAVRMSFYKYLLLDPNIIRGAGEFRRGHHQLLLQELDPGHGIYTILRDGVVLYGLGVALLLNSSISSQAP
jgi:hypothetical protein